MLNKYYTFLLLSTLITVQLFSQKKNLYKAGEKYDQYALVNAREIYTGVYNKGYESYDLLKKIGDSFYLNGELEKAVPWYEKIMDKYQDLTEPEYLYRYYQSLKAIKRYKEADKISEIFIAKSTDKQRKKLLIEEKNYLQAIEKESGKYNIINLDINTTFSDYAPSFNHKGELVFASINDTTNIDLRKDIDVWSNQPFNDLFKGAIIDTNGIIEKTEKIKGKLKGPYHESTTAFTKDGKTVYFTRSNNNKRKLTKNAENIVHLKIYRARLKNNNWAEIEELPFNNDNYSIAHPALSPDDKKLYFSSDMPSSKGLSDLYVVDIYDDNTFGGIKNLGDSINTEGRETFPYISDSGKLYFASDSHSGLGGLDVFVAEPFENKENNIEFYKPYNIGKPVNSSKDDFAYIFDEKTKIGYVSSNREGGKGYDDIYAVKPNPPKPKKEIVVKPGNDLAKILKLQPIYFDFDKSFIRPDAEVEIQQVIETLKKYPNIKIEIRSHTDSRANDQYNIDLSERRAKSTLEYIVNVGEINKSRIKSKGFGETQLVNKCKNDVLCSKEEHQLNRRSEFIVLKND